MAAQTISGSLSALFLFDVCDEIRLDDLRRILKSPPPGREPPFRQPAPGHVQFARPPILESIPPVELPGGERASGRIAYFDYGVISLTLVLPFTGTWEEIVALSARWMNAPDLERKASDVIGDYVAKARPALIDELPEKLIEDYYVVWLPPLFDDAQRPMLGGNPDR